MPTIPLVSTTSAVTSSVNSKPPWLTWPWYIISNQFELIFQCLEIMCFLIVTGCLGQPLCRSTPRFGQFLFRQRFRRAWAWPEAPGLPPYARTQRPGHPAVFFGIHLSFVTSPSHPPFTFSCIIIKHAISSRPVTGAAQRQIRMGELAVGPAPGVEDGERRHRVHQEDNRLLCRRWGPSSE
jgi:hypothetical protein